MTSSNKRMREEIIGLSKREWLAGLAMQGLFNSNCPGPYTPTQLAILAVECADAALAALAKQKKEPKCSHS